MTKRLQLMIAALVLTFTTVTGSYKTLAQSQSNSQSDQAGAKSSPENSSSISGNQPTQPPAQDLKARVKDAEQIIEQNHNFQLHAKQFHLGAQAQIDAAMRLTGRAQQLQKQAIPLHGKLDAVQLKGATSQFVADLNMFKLHAKDYADHLQAFRDTLGECHKDEAEYAEAVRRHTLHCDEFHVPNIPPPHVCGDMDLTAAESRRVQNTLVNDRGRMVQAEQKLRDEEQKLKDAVEIEPHLMGKVHTASKRMEEERKIAGEFARLAEEYKTLQIEREYVAGSAKVATSTVRAQIKKSR
jgi:hypothetical protein